MPKKIKMVFFTTAAITIKYYTKSSSGNLQHNPGGDIFHLLRFMVANESERICPFVPVELKMSGGIRDFRPVIVPFVPSRDYKGISKLPQIQLILLYLKERGSLDIPLLSLFVTLSWCE